MAKFAVFFLVLSFSTIVMGANSLVGITLDISKALTFLFLLLAVLSFILSLLGNKRAIHW